MWSGETGGDVTPALRGDLVGVRVAVVGAGLGGLCLAQGLKFAGADVVVYERDGSMNARHQGYRLHVDARAGLALHRCLPAELFPLFLATYGEPSTRFTVMSEHMRVLHEISNDHARDPLTAGTLSTSVNRHTLREILAIGLDDQLQFDKELASYRDGPEIALSFADGSQGTADVLVGADGVNSVVRRQRLPDAQVSDVGGRCIYGKTMLDESVMALVPARMKEGFTAIIGGDIGMAAGLVRFRERPEHVDARLSPAGDYLMWAISGKVDAFGKSDAFMSVMSADELHGLATHVIRTWHRDLRALVARARWTRPSWYTYTP